MSSFGQSVQFRTGEAALQAFKNTGCQAWSVHQQKQMIYKGIGDEDLAAFLGLLVESGASNAVYTIAYYEDIDNKKAIKSNTANDGSFNFRLNSDNQEITTYQYNKFNSSNELQSKVAGLESKLDSLLTKFEEEEIPEEKPNKLGIIGEIIAHPAISPMIPQLLQSFLGSVLGQNQPPAPGVVIPGMLKSSQMAAVGNIVSQPIPGVTSFNQNSVKEVSEDPIDKAISILLSKDPQLAEHLTKLAHIAVHDPASFNIILASLNGYAIQ